MSSEGSLAHFAGLNSTGVGGCASDLLRLAAAGAMVGGAWSVFTDAGRVRAEELSLPDAVRHTVQNAAIGAGAGMVVGAAACVAKTHPGIGVLAVLTLGVGALYLAERSRPQPVGPAAVDIEAESGSEAETPRPRRRTRRAATE